MANVTSEHEAGDVLHAATLEVAEELERVQKDQGRLQDDLAAATKNFPTAGQHTRPRAIHFARPSWKSASAEQLTKRSVSKRNRRATHEENCVEAKKALHRTFEIKRKASEIQEGVATHKERTRRDTNEHARAEGHVNDGIASLGRALQAAAKATHTP